MTSRDVSCQKREDSLDVLIRSALQEGVADAVPSPSVWQRINEQLVERSGPSDSVAWWERLRLSFDAMAHRVLDLPLYPSAEFAPGYPPLPRYLWETDGLWLLLPQGGLPVRPGSAGSGVLPRLG